MALRTSYFLGNEQVAGSGWVSRDRVEVVIQLVTAPTGHDFAMS